MQLFWCVCLEPPSTFVIRWFGEYKDVVILFLLFSCDLCLKVRINIEEFETGNKPTMVNSYHTYFVPYRLYTLCVINLSLRTKALPLCNTIILCQPVTKYINKCDKKAAFIYLV